MKKILILPFAVFSHLLFAGGFSGGGPPPLLLESDMIIMSTVPDLGLEKVELPIAGYRRTRMRLSVEGVSSVPLGLDNGERAFDVKLSNGAITSLSEDIQVVPTK
jgi:hypothetical protein